MYIYTIKLTNHLSFIMAFVVEDCIHDRIQKSEEFDLFRSAKKLAKREIMVNFFILFLLTY